MEQPCEITVLYALHESEETVPDFPAQTLPAEQIQVIPIRENDPYQPRMQALESLSEAKGTYTILLDVGDRFSDNFLELMLSRVKQDQGAFSMPVYARGYNRNPPRKQPPAQVSYLFDARECPTYFPVTVHGLLIPTASFQQAVRENPEPVEREKRIILHLLEQNPLFSYMGSARLEYILPRENEDQYDIRSSRKEWYFDSFEQFLLPLLAQMKQTRGEVPLLLQHMAKYMVSIRFAANKDNRNKFALEPEDVPRFTDLMSSVLQYVSVQVILDKSVERSKSSPTSNLIKLRMKKNDWNWYPDVECTETTVHLICEGRDLTQLGSTPVYITLIDYRDGRLEIDGSYPDYFPESTRISVQFGLECYQLQYNERYSLTKYFGVSFYRNKTFHVSIPVPDVDEIRKSEKGELQLNFYLQPEGERAYRMGFRFSGHTSRFANSLTAGYWRFGPYLAYWSSKTGIHVRPSSPVKVLKREVKLWGQLMRRPSLRKYVLLKIPNFLMRPWFSRQHIWLFMDKIYKGGDSSEYIYKYAAAQKDGIRKYYLLDKSSADYARLKKEGYHPLRRGGLKHRLIFLNASMVIASNSTVFSFNSYSTNTSQAIRGDVHFDVACVQHGMSVQKIAKAQNRLRDNTKLYFCASKYEIENLSKPVYDYQGYDALKLTGVPRYDGLKNRAEKILLLSPTWRMNSVLPPEQGESVARAYNPHFKETDYYRVYNSLINDPRLLAAAKQYGYRIQYVLHPLVSQQAEDFVQNDMVEIIPAIGDMSYEKLFCEAALMVTDFSGVQFDFAYMRKPVIYLHHHDIPQHYEEGTFFYETMGFGEICHTNDELIDVLCEYMKNDCRMPDLYRERADDFFAYSDNRNCERIYPIMLEHEMSS